jgi:hypothetical protein
MADFCNSCVDSWQGDPDGGHGMPPRRRANPRSAAFGNLDDMRPAEECVEWQASRVCSVAGRSRRRSNTLVVVEYASRPVRASTSVCFSGLRAG